MAQKKQEADGAPSRRPIIIVHTPRTKEEKKQKSRPAAPSMHHVLEKQSRVPGFPSRTPPPARSHHQLRQFQIVNVEQ